MQSWFKHLLCFFVCTLSGLYFFPAAALDFKIDGSVAVVSGEVDYPDVRRFREARDKGVKVIVLRDIDGGDIDVSFGVAKDIQGLGFTMVLDGGCGGSCPELLLAGKERRYMQPSQDKSSYVLIRSAVFVGYIQGAANISEVYVHFRPRLTDVISNALLRKHTTGYLNNSGLLFWPASKNNQVVECDDLDRLNECLPVEGATAVNSGMFTSTEPYPLAVAVTNKVN